MPLPLPRRPGRRSVEDDDGKDLEEVAVRIQRSFEDHGARRGAGAGAGAVWWM